MSFKTFQHYNGDNVSKTIELIGEKTDRPQTNKEESNMDKILKDALNIRVDGVMWEPLHTKHGKRWFNWKDLKSYTEDEFKIILENSTYEALMV